MQYVLPLHLVGVVLWMGSLMALTRVLAFHTREVPSVRPRFSFLEERLDLYAAVPGAFITLVTGLVQIALEPPGYFRLATWLHVKLALVVVMAVLHVVVLARRRRIAAERADAPIGRALFGAAHGILGLLLVAVMYLAILRPMATP